MDISEASASLGVFAGALTCVALLFGQDSFRYRGLAVQPDILHDIRCSVVEAVADHIFDGLISLRLFLTRRLIQFLGDKFYFWVHFVDLCVIDRYS